MNSKRMIAGLVVAAASAVVIPMLYLQDEVPDQVLVTEPSIDRSTGSSNMMGEASEDFDSLAAQVAAINEGTQQLMRSQINADVATGGLREQMALLQEKMSDMESHINIEQTKPILPGDAAGSGMDALDDDQLAYAAEQQQLEEENAFLMQELDPQWAIGTESEIRERLAGAGGEEFPGGERDISSMVSSLECRTNTCQLVMPQIDDMDLEELQIRIISGMGDLFEGGSVQLSDNGGMVFYMHAEQ